MKLIAVILMLGLSTLCLGQPQPGEEEEVLARISSQAITVRDYLERIDLVPWPGKDNPGTRDSAKITALASLAAETLLSMQAIEQGVTTAETTRRELKALERVLARDELYRTEVMNKVSFTSDEVFRGLERFAWILTLNSYVMDSEGNARRLAAALNQKGKKPIPTRGIVSHDTITVGFGDLMESYEREAFAIDSVNEARVVNASDYRWAVLELLAKSPNESYTHASVAERQAVVRRKIKQRKESELASNYLRGVFSRKIQMDSTVFMVFAENLRSIILRDSAGRREEGSYGIRNDDVDTLKVLLKQWLGKSLITMGRHTVSLEEVIDELKYFSLQFTSLRRRPFLQGLNQGLQRLAEAGIISDEAMDRKMNWHSSVKRELGVWGDALQADKLLRHLSDSLGNAFHEDTSCMQDSADYAAEQDSRAVDFINRYISRLAEQYQLEMDFKKLKGVHINPSNLVTRRMIGFGGGMMGMPMILPLFDWLEVWEVSKPVPQ